MFNKRFSLFFCALLVCFSACQNQPEYCTVKGTVKGIKDGTRLELEDEFDHYKVIATTRVKDGAYEFHPRISAPTHVYLYTRDGDQLKDFYLEPGTIVADVDFTDDDDWTLGAIGTPSNDFDREIQLLWLKGENALAEKRWEEIIDAGENGILALYYASNVSPSAVQSLEILDRLSPEIASKPTIAELREELTRRARTEPAPEGSSPHYFIDLEYPDAGGTPVSLSSVVHHPANHLVILDFWATWCDPCRDALPALKALYAQYHGKGLEIYSVSEDADEDDWRAFVAENGMTWVNVLDPEAGRSHSKAWFDYALHGIPTTLLLDGVTGEILLRSDLKDIEASLASLLE